MFDGERAHALVGVELDGERAVGGAGDARFKLRQFHRRETHRALHRLPMREDRVERFPQKLFALRLRRFEKPAEKIIMLDAQRARVGELAVFSLQRRDDAAAFIAQRAGIVEFGDAAGTNEAAVALVQRRLIGERRAQFGFQRRRQAGEGPSRLGDFVGRLDEARNEFGKRRGRRRPIA